MRNTLLFFVALAGWTVVGPVDAGPDTAFKSDEIEAVFQFSLAPSGITTGPDGSWLLSVSQAEKPKTRVVKVSKSGKVEPFPNEKMSDAAPDSPLPLDAVEGMQLGADGFVWMLDNGRRSEISPKIVAWNYEKNRLQRVHYIGQPAVVPGSYLADLAVDPGYPFVYVSDPANGPDAAIIVLDCTTGLARRVLQGHPSVVPNPSVRLQASRTRGESRRLDGVQTIPHSGVDPIALDRKGEWLYFAPLRSDKLYRIKTELLRSPDTSAEKLGQSIETYADKPPATSISIDNKGNIYVGDIEGRAIGVIDAEKRDYRVLTSDPRLVGPDGLCFGSDGKLYFFSCSQFATQSSQSSRPSATLSTASSSSVEHSLFRLRMKPLAGGRAGD
jgi:sugar lactone lactonase YvrE